MGQVTDCEKFNFAIDRGGTFTDVYATCPGGRVRVLKLLSVDPANYADAPREGIRRILKMENKGVGYEASDKIPTDLIGWIRMGTTVATNALLERKGERMALVTTRGFKDLLYIGNQARPKIFDLEIVCPDVLYEVVVEAHERIVLVNPKCEIKRQCKVVKGVTGEKVEIWESLDLVQLEKDLIVVYEKGIRSVAVALLHSYIYQKHEEQVKELALKLGFEHVSLSSQIMPMVKIVPRGFTACADAYLTPHIKKYLSGFSSGFQEDLRNVNVLFMQSDGGLTPMDQFNGSRAILSGPAGGVVGYAITTFQQLSNKRPVIGFDMGGTSTDVSRYNGEYEHVFESTTAGITIQAPQMDVNTVAAGGGSVLVFRSGLFHVGPESASAHPGPVCYKKGGPLTVTDANLLLGRLLPDYFPKIFGPDENQPLDKEGTCCAFDKLTMEVNDFLSSQTSGDAIAPGKSMTSEEVAMGFIRVANEAMCRPIRALTQGKGYDTTRHVLACFGGAGGQHACAIAKSLGIKTIFIHKYAGILSAYGMALADVVHEAQEPCSKTYNEFNLGYIDERLSDLAAVCHKELVNQGFQHDSIETVPYLNLRYDKTDCSLMCTPNSILSSDNEVVSQYGDFLAAFLHRYQTEFGFTLDERDIIVDDIRVRGVGKSTAGVRSQIPAMTEPPLHETVTFCYFEDGFAETRVFLLCKLLAGHRVLGPAIIIDQTSTILIEPDSVGTITDDGSVVVECGSLGLTEIGTDLDSIQLSIFSHRFMSIAEQMGRILQRTSISTNIKERLDFSCALFGPDGGLVSNAPHIPVHLGAMQETVQFQINFLGDELNEGDVLLSNHPCAGGSHLPDLTVITPVFYPGSPRPVFFVASRGHHADIGGITPGSMPPHSKILAEEGACFMSFKLVAKGIFQEQAIITALTTPGPCEGCSGTRTLQDNLSDLRAQIAANHKGIKLVCELINTYSLTVVQAYMNYVQSNADIAVRNMLRDIAEKASPGFNGQVDLDAVDYMDDGSEIRLKVSIDSVQGTATFDFTGSGDEVYGNSNAPRAITISALIYSLRCMVGYDVPLNQGFLKPIKLIIPKNSILDPSGTAAVVGGNVTTSQRIVDVIFKAFEVCAASQGDMNNITFGDETIGYYETVAGGAGAGKSWHGRSGVHTHMTNTRITDPEILERRYPVVLSQFGLIPGTGGRGLYRGGDGVARELLFRKSLTLSILTERRVFQPYGLKGGEPGSKGRNYLLRDGRRIYLGSKNSVLVKPGDCFRLETPGGGGYGVPEEGGSPSVTQVRKAVSLPLERGSVHEYRMAQESA